LFLDASIEPPMTGGFVKLSQHQHPERSEQPQHPH